jgi:uncharacterized membrane protein YesL
MEAFLYFYIAGGIAYAAYIYLHTRESFLWVPVNIIFGPIVFIIVKLRLYIFILRHKFHV